MEEELIDKLIATGDYKILKRLVPQDYYHKPDGADINIGVYLDTETTGLNPDKDKVIELAMVPFEYSSDGNIYRVFPAYNSFSDPDIPISETVTRITGITDDMVAGHSIDLDRVSEILSTTKIIIAHNAKFDRPFCEEISSRFRDIPWGCSIADVNWENEGIDIKKLGYLAYLYGFYFDAHRATVDCQAGIHILSQVLPISDEVVLKQLLDSATSISVRLWAENSPFSMKNELKKRGYKWSGGDVGGIKAWYRDLPEQGLAAELGYLGEHIYGKPVDDLPTLRTDSLVRYSKRS